MMKDSSFSVSRKAQMLHKVVIVDGFPGCGKTMMSPIISSFDRVEIMQYSPQIEQICELFFLEAIKDDVAQSMVRLNCDNLIYWVTMGRHTNFRPSDLSSIFKNNPLKHIKRMLSSGDELVPEIIYQNKPLLHLATHMLLPSAKLLFEALSDKLIFLEVVRHPLYMIIQQERNFEMFEGPRNLHIRYSLDNKEYNFFSKGWEDLFRRSNSFEKAIYSIQWYFNFLFEEYDSRVQIIPFEIFVKQPENYMKEIASNIGSNITKKVKREMYNQKVPRKQLSDAPALDIYKRCGWEPPKYFSEEKELEARREFISQNVSTEALKALDKVCEEYVSKFLTSKI